MHLERLVFGILRYGGDYTSPAVCGRIDLMRIERTQVERRNRPAFKVTLS
jgi:hypothetical protein